MDGTEWKSSSGDAPLASGSGQSVKPRRRTLVERELETSLTSKITSPSVASEGGTSVSRYGRARKAKTDEEFCNTDSPSKSVSKMNMMKSPAQQETTTQSNNVTKSTEKIVMSSFSPKTESIASPKTDKIYIRKDMIQNDPSTFLKNTSSPSKSNSHLNNILERSSTYNLDSEIEKTEKSNSPKKRDKSKEKLNYAKKTDKSIEKPNVNSTKKESTSEKRTINIKRSNSYADTSSVVKALDFDTGKKKKVEEVKNLPSKSELFEMEAKCAFQVGDLAWARVGTYPFWPCIITREPFSEMFLKKKLFGRVERNILHVTFFADNGRRGWVVDNMLRMFTGIQEFEATKDNFTPEDKKKDPKFYAAFFVSEKKKEIWNRSVEEAETFLREPKRLRIDMLRDMLSKNKNVKVAKKPKSVKVTRTDSDVSLSESLYDTLFSEDDSKTEEDPRRSRNKSLDVSEVVTACLDNMAAKTGIPIIQKQSHMDRWLQKAKSKTPEKPQSQTPNKLNLSLKKKKTPAKEKRKKDSKNLKAYNVEHDYTKNDIENENPVSNTNVVQNHVEYTDQINDVTVENNVSKVNAPYDIETSIVDEVMETDDDKNEESQELMNVDEPDSTANDKHNKLHLDKSNVSKDAIINTSHAGLSIEDADHKDDAIDGAKSKDKVRELFKNLDSEEPLSQAYEPDLAFEVSNKNKNMSESKVNNLLKNLENDSEELLSQAYEPDVAFEGSNNANNCKPDSAKTTDCVDLTNSDVEDTSKINDTVTSPAKKSKKKSKKTNNNKTADSKNLSNSVSEEFCKTNTLLKGSTPKTNKSKSRKSFDKVTPTVTIRDNRPKRKHAKYAYKIGGTDDPEFLIYFEMHQDSIMDEIPDLSEEDLIKYLHKTWCYERDIKSNLLMEDTDDDDVKVIEEVSDMKKVRRDEKVPDTKINEITKEAKFPDVKENEVRDEDKVSDVKKNYAKKANKVSDDRENEVKEKNKVPDVKENEVKEDNKVPYLKKNEVKAEDKVPDVKENEVMEEDKALDLKENEVRNKEIVSDSTENKVSEENKKNLHEPSTQEEKIKEVSDDKENKKDNIPEVPENVEETIITVQKDLTAESAEAPVFEENKMEENDTEPPAKIEEKKATKIENLITIDDEDDEVVDFPKPEEKKQPLINSESILREDALSSKAKATEKCNDDINNIPLISKTNEKSILHEDLILSEAMTTKKCNKDCSNKISSITNKSEESILLEDVNLTEAKPTENYINDDLNQTKTTPEEAKLNTVKAPCDNSIVNEPIHTITEDITSEGKPNVTQEDITKDEVINGAETKVEDKRSKTKLYSPKVALKRENLEEKLIATKSAKIKKKTNMAKRKREVKVSLVRENLEEKLLSAQKVADLKPSHEEIVHSTQILQASPEKHSNGNTVQKDVDVCTKVFDEAKKLDDNKLIAKVCFTEINDELSITTFDIPKLDIKSPVPKSTVAKTSNVEIIGESKESQSRDKGEEMLNTILKLMEPIQSIPINKEVNKTPVENAMNSNINENDDKIVREETTKSIEAIKEANINEELVDLTEEEDDDDIPSPEFEEHTVDSKEKEFISELKKNIVPELLKDPYYVYIKTENVDPSKEEESAKKCSNATEACDIDQAKLKSDLQSKELTKNLKKDTKHPENDTTLPVKSDKLDLNIDDDISLDSFTEDALLQSDDEDANSSRAHFESIAEDKTSEMDISRTDTDTTKLVKSNKVTTDVNKSISPEIRKAKTKLSLRKSSDLQVNVTEEKSGTIKNKPAIIANKNIEDNSKNLKPLVNGFVEQTKLTEIVTNPIRNSDKLNGYLTNNQNIFENGINENDTKDKVSRPKRKLRSKSEANKNAYNAFEDPEFMLYVESRQDAVCDENPGLSENEVIQYLHKTWMYEQELKTDRQKDDDVEQSKLVKGLITQYNNISKPKKVKRTTSIPVVRLERMDLAEKKDAIVDIPNGIADSDSDCEVVSNGHLIDTISIVSEKDSSSEYVPSDDEVSTSSHDIDDIKSLAKIKAEICGIKAIEKTIKVTANVSEKVESKTDIASENATIPQMNIEIVAAKSEKTGESANIVPKQEKNTDPVAVEDLITLADLNVEERKPYLDLSSPLKSDSSEDNTRPKRKQRIKTERNPDFPSVREVNSALDDPDFLKYLELRQDALIDENPHVTQDDIVKYLYKTWVYEQNLKTETEKIDEIEQSNLVKGENDQSAQPKKIRKKVKQEKEREFKIEKNKEKEIDDLPPKDKSRRRATKTFYHEDDTDIEEELEVFEIFKTKKKTTDIKSEVKTELKTETNTDETKTDETKAEEIEEEEADDIEAYFLKLTQPKANLFKGLPRERVCEICFKTGRLVKCKGLCGGLFHVDCVKNENIKEDEPQPLSRGRKKKKNRPCPWLRYDGKKDLDDSQSDKEIIIEEPELMVIDADEFEAKLSAKMKEVLKVEEVIEIDSSSDDDITWKETKLGHCEIIDVKLKLKRTTDYDDFKCNNCQNFDTPICFVCKSTKSPKNNTELRQKCQFSNCHKYYHVECLDFWPQTQIVEGKDNTTESITCPRHVCHTCVSDDPRGCKTRFSADKLAKCVKCPATYHSFTKCLPAGSKILSASHIICPRHYETKPNKVPCHVNTGWCFICAEGGTLICCEYCPTAFHAECLQIKPPDGNYMCEDCETGRLPLYGEMVWVKLGHYRWWPGIVLHPAEIPDNIKAIKHSHGEFVVRFFGQYDHYWVNRGRVFPFQEGDSGRVSSQKSKIDEAFTVAIEHASRAFEILKKAPPNAEEDTDIQSSLLPPHYVKLRVNKPVGSLVNKKVEDLNSLTQCECDPRDTDPCGVDSQCLNRMLLTECGPTCLAGDRCNNRMFEKRQYPRLAAHKAAHRGWGLRTLEEIPAGRFIIEYVGELVDEVEFRRRMRSKHEARDENYYFLTLDKGRVIDAGPKGNLARFMNHSCEPNCETQKWTVLGDVRVGLFAINDIPANSELTFNYNLECAGIEKKRCMCGAKRCSGYIGAKPKTLEETQPKKSKPIQKRTYKKRKVQESPPVKKVAKPRTTLRSRPKELTEIEKDLLIIKNATNGISSDSESSRLNSIEKEERKALKRKRVSFSADEVILYNSDSSPLVKKVKTDDSDSVSVSCVSVSASDS